jgi:predicted ATPase
VNWEPGVFVEESDPTRSVRLFNCSLLLNGRYAGSVNLCVSDQALVYRSVPVDADLGHDLLQSMISHIDGLFQAGLLPRTDHQIFEFRVVDDGSGQFPEVAYPQWLATPLESSQKQSGSRTGAATFSGLDVAGVFGFGTAQELGLHGRCTIAVGENGSGKSSIRKVVSALKSIARGEAPFSSNESWLHVGVSAEGQAQPSLVVHASLPDEGLLNYSIGFAQSKSGAATITSEQLRKNSAPHDLLTRPSSPFGCVFVQRTRTDSKDFESLAYVAGPADPSRSSLSQLANPSLYPEASAMRDLLSDVRLYSSWDLADARLVAASANGSSTVDSSTTPPALLDDGSNLAAFIARLQRMGGKPKFDDWFERAMDGRPILRVDADRLMYEHDGRSLSVLDLSDGSLRWAQVVAACMSPASLRVLDEPELGLHPDLIASLAELIAECSVGTQTLVFTHSRDLLDQLEESFADISEFGLIAFEQDQSGNLISVPDIPLIRDDEELGQLSLGQLWVKGFLGGNRW